MAHAITMRNLVEAVTRNQWPDADGLEKNVILWISHHFLPNVLDTLPRGDHAIAMRSLRGGAQTSLLVGNHGSRYQHLSKPVFRRMNFNAPRGSPRQLGSRQQRLFH